MCFGCTANGKIWWSALFGCISIISSITIGILWPQLFETAISNQMKLTEYSSLYKNWVERPVPLYFEVYMFNWSNIDNIKNWREETPRFDELGPYVFEENAKRINLEYSEGEQLLAYDEVKTWTFRPDLSKGHLSDRIYNVNPVTLTTIWTFRYLESLFEQFPQVAEIIGQTLEEYSSLAIGNTVGEWLFDGISIDILDALQDLLNSGLIPPEIPIPEFPYDKFGWFYGRNGSATSGGRYKINTGKDDIKKLGILSSWNNKDTVPGLRGECAKIKGTTPEVYPPPDKNQDITFFIPDVCRSLTFKRSGSIKKLGVKGYNYIGDDSVFDNGKKYPEAACWCTASDEKCPALEPGVFDSSKCLYGSPGFISFPHFYLADRSYLDAVEGLDPKKDLHESHIALEPNTGIPIEAQAKFQINFFLREDKHISMFKGVPNLYVPMLWFNQRGELDEENAGQIKLLQDAANFGLWTSIAIGVLGAVFIVASGLFIYQKRKASPEPTSMSIK